MIHVKICKFNHAQINLNVKTRPIYFPKRHEEEDSGSELVSLWEKLRKTNSKILLRSVISAIPTKDKDELLLKLVRENERSLGGGVQEDNSFKEEGEAKLKRVYGGGQIAKYSIFSKK